MEVLKDFLSAPPDLPGAKWTSSKGSKLNILGGFAHAFFFCGVNKSMELLANHYSKALDLGAEIAIKLARRVSDVKKYYRPAVAQDTLVFGVIWISKTKISEGLPKRSTFRGVFAFFGQVESSELKVPDVGQK